jgi:phosphatidyl-myo-inositol dimannoside synthase
MQDMKNILFFSTEFPPGPGGIGTHAYQQARHFHALGWQVTVLTHQDYVSNREIETFNRQQPFRILRLTRPGGTVREVVHRLMSLRRALVESRADVVMATGERAVLLAALARLSMPWVAVWHGVVPPAAWKRLITRQAYRRADAVIAVSNYTAGQMLAMGVRPRTLHIIPNGADEQTFFPLESSAVSAFRQSLGLRDEPLLLTVGHLSDRKGQDIVISALPQILANYPDVHYLMLGLPTLRQGFELLAASLGVAEYVHFFGRADDAQLVQAYNACDVFVLTSRHASGDFEGFGIVAVEAALCQKPAVVAGNSGLVEAIQDGKTGLVVPEDNPEATAQAILRLLQDRDLLQSYGLAARERALSEQTWSRCVQHYDLVLRQLLGASKHIRRS